MAHIALMNWAGSIEQSWKNHEDAYQGLAFRAAQLDKARTALQEAIKMYNALPDQPGLKEKYSEIKALGANLREREAKMQNDFSLLKITSSRLIEAKWEFEDLSDEEKAELDSHFKTALKHFKGDRLRAIGAAAVRLQLYKIGEYFAAKETRQFLELKTPAAAVRKKAAAKYKPEWVSVSKCAKEVGISRNTVMAWHRQGAVWVQGSNGPEKIILKRHPGTGRVNLTLVHLVAQTKRKTAAPGKPLNKGTGQLAAFEIAAAGSPQLKNETAACLRALAAIEKVHSPALLNEIRTRIKRRLQARKKQSSKRRRGRLVSRDALEDEKVELRGYHSVPIRN